MHKRDVRFTILSSTKIQRLDDFWTDDHMQAILANLDMDGLDDMTANERFEMATMALADLPPHEASELLLHVVLGERLREGQMDEIAHEMLVERLWEDHPDIALHEAFFNVGQLLCDCQPGRFPKPNGLRIQIRLDSDSADPAALGSIVNEATLVRAMGRKLDGNTRLVRMFDDQIKSGPFPEAEHIFWRLDTVTDTGNELTIAVTGSEYWLGPVQDLAPFTEALEF